jgi:hypothetical protein
MKSPSKNDAEFALRAQCVDVEQWSAQPLAPGFRFCVINVLLVQYYK